jgi:hypothetical protein
VQIILDLREFGLRGEAGNEERCRLCGSLENDNGIAYLAISFLKENNLLLLFFPLQLYFPLSVFFSHPFFPSKCKSQSILVFSCCLTFSTSKGFIIRVVIKLARPEDIVITKGLVTGILLLIFLILVR